MEDQSIKRLRGCRGPGGGWWKGWAWAEWDIWDICCSWCSLGSSAAAQGLYSPREKNSCLTEFLHPLAFGLIESCAGLIRKSCQRRIPIIQSGGQECRNKYLQIGLGEAELQPSNIPAMAEQMISPHGWYHSWRLISSAQDPQFCLSCWEGDNLKFPIQKGNRANQEV